MKKIISPIVNINGTSSRELLEQQEEAVMAVRKAYEALQKAAPHGRDYQTAPEGTYCEARQQYNDWMGQLNDIQNGLTDIWNAINDQRR